MSVQTMIDDIAQKRNLAYELFERKEFERARGLFEAVFDGQEPTIAVCLGYIYHQQSSSVYDPEKAISYYRIAADANEPYAKAALAELLMKRGRIEEAEPLCASLSEAGNAECTWALYQLYSSQGREREKRVAFERAVQQEQPIAVQRYAVEMLLGRRGYSQIPLGIAAYFRNIPRLWRYVKKFD